MVSKYKRLQDQLIIYISNFQRLSAMLLERGETDRQTDIDLASGHSDYCTTPLTQTHTHTANAESDQRRVCLRAKTLSTLPQTQAGLISTGRRQHGGPLLKLKEVHAGGLSFPSATEGEPLHQAPPNKRAAVGPASDPVGCTLGTPILSSG